MFGEGRVIELNRVDPNAVSVEVSAYGEPSYTIVTGTGRVKKSFRDVLHLPARVSFDGIADENDASLIWNEHRVGLNFSALRDMLRDTASWRREKADEFADDPLDLDIARLMDELADDVSRRIANGEEFAYRAKASHRLILARADTLMTASFNRDFPMADGTLRPLVRDGNFVAFENYVVELRAAIRARAVVET